MRKATTVSIATLALIFAGLALAGNTNFTSIGGLSATTLSVGGSGTSAKTQVVVSIPKVLILQIQTTDTNPGKVVFDFTSTSAGRQAWANAVQVAPALIRFNSTNSYMTTNLKKVRVFTNASTSLTVTGTVTESSGGTLPMTDLYIGGVPVPTSGAVSLISESSSVTHGWQAVVTPSSFGIMPDPSATPGSSTFTITYTATAN